MTSKNNEETIVVAKVIVLGAADVGKTALINRYCCDKFSDYRIPTVGSNFQTKLIELDERKVALQLWDTSGQKEQFQTLGSGFYRKANGAILVYDVMNSNSLQQLAQWRNDVLSKIDVGVYFPIIVIGNKIDLKAKKCLENKEIDLKDIDDTWPESVIDHKELKIKYEELEKAGLIVLQWCRYNSYHHIETSAKEDIGVTVAMLAISALALRASVINKKEIGHNDSHGKKIDLEHLYVVEAKGVFEKYLGWDATFFGGGGAKSKL